MKKIIFILILVFAFVNCDAQLTQKDFKLSLDNHFVGDDSLSHRITKEKLLKSKRLVPNFNWATIKSFSLYVSPSCSIVNTCKGELICKEMLPILQRLTPNSFVTFEAIVINKQGKEVPWSGFTLKIVE
jgi:hypothetical protein